MTITSNSFLSLYSNRKCSNRGVELPGNKFFVKLGQDKLLNALSILYNVSCKLKFQWLPDLVTRYYFACIARSHGDVLLTKYYSIYVPISPMSRLPMQTPCTIIFKLFLANINGLAWLATSFVFFSLNKLYRGLPCRLKQYKYCLIPS